MKFKPANPNSVCGTSLAGQIDVSYAKLCKVFGDPNSDSDGYKTDAEWVLEFDDDGETVVATIYNYKDGKNYLKHRGKATSRIRNWHVGGHETRAVDLVNKALAIHNK